MGILISILLFSTGVVFTHGYVTTCKEYKKTVVKQLSVSIYYYYENKKNIFPFQIKNKHLLWKHNVHESSDCHLLLYWKLKLNTENLWLVKE